MTDSLQPAPLHRQLTVSVNRDDVDRVESLLQQYGALCCTCKDAANTPILEPAPGTTPLWGRTEVTGLFEQQTDIDLVAHLVSAELQLDLRDISTVDLQDQQWERAWMEDFAPRQITERLWVVPSFNEPPDPDAINLIIDPGLAFGSGTHATTILCLEWLASQSLENKVVLDYGCGSGILAIAAALLGASKVYALDIDPQAEIATRENAIRNGVSDRIELVNWAPGESSQAIDVLVANILLSPLLQLRDSFASVLGADGKLGLSGVLAEQAPELKSCYAEKFFGAQVLTREEWILYSASAAQQEVTRRH